MCLSALMLHTGSPLTACTVKWWIYITPDHSIVFISHKPSGARMQLLGPYNETTFRALLQHVGGKCLKSLKGMIQTKNLFCHILRNSLLQSTFLFMNNWEIKLPELLPLINHTLLKTPTSNQGHKIYLHYILLCGFHCFIDSINIPFQMKVLPFVLTVLAALFANYSQQTIPLVPATYGRCQAAL